ncbi:MAG: hypothetical protein R2795_14595 [Saprospiraceae bacterium]
MEFPFVYHSIADYRQTLRSLAHWIAELPVQCLVPGHGDATTDKDEMQRRLEEAHWYLDQLEAYAKGHAFDEVSLWDRYPDFRSLLVQYHRENLELARNVGSR